MQNRKVRGSFPQDISPILLLLHIVSGWRGAYKSVAAGVVPAPPAGRGADLSRPFWAGSWHLPGKGIPPRPLAFRVRPDLASRSEAPLPAATLSTTQIYLGPSFLSPSVSLSRGQDQAGVCKSLRVRPPASSPGRLP